MEVFKDFFENPFFTPKNAFFVFWDLEEFWRLDKTLVHYPDWSKRCWALKIGMRLPIDTGYGGFQGIFRKSIFYPKKCVFRTILGLRRILASGQNLVHHPDWSKRCRAIKIGMCLPIGTGYGGFQGIFRKSIFYPKKCVFRNLGLRRILPSR